MTLRVGCAQGIITPCLESPVFLAGFGQNRLAETVHDDLSVRVLALEQGDTRLALAALDLIGLSRHHCLEIGQHANERVTDVRLIVACTHVHHGPDTIGLWGPDLATTGVDPDYLAGTKTRVVDTVVAAWDRIEPAWLRVASVRVPGVAKNARDPHIVDDELTCVQFCHPGEDAVVATVLDFPCHPEVLGEDNPHITSDYPGYLRHRVAVETGAPCLFFSGAIGGMMTPDVEDHSFEEAEEIGEFLARAALDALSGAKARGTGKIAYTCSEFTIPMENPVFQMAMEAGLLPHILDDDGAVTTEAGLLKIGPAWFASVPGELLPGLGLTLKADLQRAGAQVAGIIGLANDELGYILPEEDYVFPANPFEPGDHYEETMSIGPQIGPRLLSTLRSCIHSQGGFYARTGDPGW
jgi:hypothetical protein